MSVEGALKFLSDNLDIAALFKELDSDEQFGGCFPFVALCPEGCFVPEKEKPYDEPGMDAAILCTDASSLV